jgi:hypothetical protein
MTISAASNPAQEGISANVLIRTRRDTRIHSAGIGHSGVPPVSSQPTHRREPYARSRCACASSRGKHPRAFLQRLPLRSNSLAVVQQRRSVLLGDRQSCRKRPAPLEFFRVASTRRERSRRVHSPETRFCVPRIETRQDAAPFLRGFASRRFSLQNRRPGILRLERAGPSATSLDPKRWNSDAHDVKTTSLGPAPREQLQRAYGYPIAQAKSLIKIGL